MIYFWLPINQIMFHAVVIDDGKNPKPEIS
jgi:hypothetical protein